MTTIQVVDALAKLLAENKVSLGVRHVTALEGGMPERISDIQYPFIGVDMNSQIPWDDTNQISTCAIERRHNLEVFVWAQISAEPQVSLRAAIALADAVLEFIRANDREITKDGCAKNLKATIVQSTGTNFCIGVMLPIVFRDIISVTEDY